MLILHLQMFNHSVRLLIPPLHLISTYRLRHPVFGKVLGNVHCCICRRTLRECGWLVDGVFRFKSFIEDTKRGGGAILVAEEGEFLVDVGAGLQDGE